MFTNEFEFEATVTTVLDETDECEDVQLIIDDFSVTIRQFNEISETYDLICMSHKQFGEMVEALKHPEGAYRIFFKKVEEN